MIKVIVESDEEHRAADEALADGRLDFGAHDFVIKRERRPGPGGSAGVTLSAGGSGNGGGGSCGCGPGGGYSTAGANSTTIGSAGSS